MPQPGTPGEDIAAIVSYLLETEASDYHDNPHENGIYPAALRVQAWLNSTGEDDNDDPVYVQIAVHVPRALENDLLALALVAEAAQDYVNETYDDEGNPR